MIGLIDISPAKPKISEWLSRSDIIDCTAGMPSPPWRFSTTTAWPQRSESLSATVRAAMSMPLPGPSGVIRRTVRCGQGWAGACADDGALAAPRTSAEDQGHG